MSFIDEWLKTIVPVGKTASIILFILNIVLPGFGTMINACMADRMNVLGLLIGIA